MIFHKMKHAPSYFPFPPLFYILAGVKVGYFLTINQIFAHHPEFY